MTKKTEYLIAGAGIIGLTLARELLAQGADNITVIEKEQSVAKHASGRNSGVLHSGIYYPKDSLKAKFCINGNMQLQEYCQSHQLPLHNSGKVIVTRNSNELPTLEELYKRAKANGADVSLVDETELSTIEPNAKTHKQALYSRSTAVIDPKQIMECLFYELNQHPKVTILLNESFRELKESNIAITSKRALEFEYFINTAGAYADKIAHQFGVGLDYQLIPFKGTYKKLSKEYSHLFNGNIYPVPDIQYPFLGVHFTKGIHGDVYLGPTAIPALGRENYGIFQGIDRDAFDILGKDLFLFLTNPKFRQIAVRETFKYLPSQFFQDAKQLVKELERSWLVPCDKVGIRPQLINWKTKQLVMDFLVEETGNSLHILNAISPAFTCSFAFARYLVDELIKR